MVLDRVVFLHFSVLMLAAGAAMIPLAFLTFPAGWDLAIVAVGLVLAGVIAGGGISLQTSKNTGQ